MLSLILRTLLFIFIIWQVVRFVASLMGGAKKSNRKSTTREAANYMVKDPVCGMYMDSRLAVRLENGKESAYFCSDECRNKFLHNPSESETATKANG